ncbi:MAG: hypothetical protein ACYSWU_16930, partial [Planctomycetota bacterium]
WRDELVKLKAGLEALYGERRNYRPGTAKEAPWIAHVPIRRTAGANLVIRATVKGRGPTTQVLVGYRHGDGDTDYVDTRGMGRNQYWAAIPFGKVKPGLRYFIEAKDESGSKATYPAGGAEDAIAVAVTNDNQAPTVTHERIVTAPAEKPLKVTATVRDPSGVKWVRLRYRSVTQYQDYQTLEMLPTAGKDQYAAVVPGDQVVPKWDFMYLIEVMDNHGNGKIYPDLEKEMPYVVVHLQR